MNVEKYTTKSTVDNLVYTFESIDMRTIKKMIIYSKIDNPEFVGLPFGSEVYNLAITMKRPMVLMIKLKAKMEIVRKY